MIETERKISSFPSKSLEYTFLADKVNRAFLRFPGNTEEDRRLFRRCEELFNQAIKGYELCQSPPRITSTSDTETSLYCRWIWPALHALPFETTQVGKAEDIPIALKSFRDTLKVLQGPEAFKVEPEQVEGLKAFFTQMREIAKNSDTEPVDRVNIRGFSRAVLAVG